MQSSAARLTIAGVAVVAIVILFIVLKGNSDSDSSTTVTTTAGSSGLTSGIATITIKDAKPVGGVQDLTFTQGGQIQFKVDSDVSDEVHFHGYDIGKDVEAGGSVTFDVPATIAGVFEVELENRVVPIASITVNPS
jgi:ABC-type transporter Mla subunit MlaD